MTLYFFAVHVLLSLYCQQSFFSTFRPLCSALDALSSWVLPLKRGEETKKEGEFTQPAIAFPLQKKEGFGPFSPERTRSTKTEKNPPFPVCAHYVCQGSAVSRLLKRKKRWLDIMFLEWRSVAPACGLSPTRENPLYKAIETTPGYSAHFPE